MPKTIDLTWNRCVGRDGRPLASDLSAPLAELCLNVDLRLDGLPEKRRGSFAWIFPTHFGDGYVRLGTYFGGSVAFFGVSQTNMLVWVDLTDPLRVHAAPLATVGAAIRQLTQDPDNISDRHTVNFQQFNAKLYAAYRSGTNNRLHLWDETAAGTDALNLMRVGLEPPAAPTATSTSSGGPAAEARFYRIQYLTKDAVTGRVKRLSNLGAASASFTPTPSGAFARITPAVGYPDKATHWRLWGSTDNRTYYWIFGPAAGADFPVSTLFIDEAFAPSTYQNFPPAVEEGLYTPWPSVKYLLAGIDRLIGFGVFQTEINTGKSMVPVQGRVYFSRTLGSSAEGDDDESISNTLTLKGYLDVGRGMGAKRDTGLGGPIDGNVLVFQDKGIYLLAPTGEAVAPFRRITITTEVGAVEGSIFTGQDELGRPCVYWLDETAGPYRYGAEGLQWLGYDVQDKWAFFARTAPEGLRAHGCWHNDTQTARFWFADITKFGGARPGTLIKFQARFGRPMGATGVRMGWTEDTGLFAGAYHSAVSRRIEGTFANTYQPMIGTATALLVRNESHMADDAFGTNTAYQAGIRSKVLPLDPLHLNKNVLTDWMYLQALRILQQTAPTLGIALIRNFGQDGNAFFGAPSFYQSFYLASGSAQRLLRRYEGARIEDVWVLQVEIGDPGGAVANAWQLDAWLARVEVTTQEISNRAI